MAQVTSEEDPVVVVRHYIDAFNKGDVKAMTALFAVPGSILDGLAPHVWNGPTASEDWYRDAMIAGEHEGAVDYFSRSGRNCLLTRCSCAGQGRLSNGYERHQLRRHSRTRAYVLEPHHPFRP